MRRPGKTGTDHLFMQAAGLPAYQFIQNPPESRVHHAQPRTGAALRKDTGAGNGVSPSYGRGMAGA